MLKRILFLLFVSVFLINFTRCDEEGFGFDVDSHKKPDEFGLKKLFGVKIERDDENDEEDLHEINDSGKGEEEDNQDENNDSDDEKDVKEILGENSDEAPKKPVKSFFPKKFNVKSDDSIVRQDDNDQEENNKEEISDQLSSQLNATESTSQTMTTPEPSTFDSLVEWFVSMFHSRSQEEEKKASNESEVNENSIDEE